MLDDFQKGSLDYLLLGTAALILILGTTILLSIDSKLFPLQFVYLGSAAVVFFILSRLDSIVLESVAHIFYGIVFFALLLTLFLGVVSEGVLRWLPLGPITIQPSEFAKPAVALGTAWILVKSIRFNFLLSLFLTFVVCLLVFIQPDLGTAIVIFFAWLGAVLGRGVSSKTLLRFALAALIVLPLFWFILQPYQKTRITAFFSPQDIQGTSYQSLQSIITVGSGGLFGKGLGQGSQTQLRFLPARQTDFVFASLAEELGFLGTALVLIGFFILFWRIISYLPNCGSVFARSAIGGIFLYLFAQTFINIGMNLGMLPIAGVPLPFISTGGSALVSTLMALGMVVALRK